MIKDKQAHNLSSYLLHNAMKKAKNFKSTDKPHRKDILQGLPNNQQNLYSNSIKNSEQIQKSYQIKQRYFSRNRIPRNIDKTTDIDIYIIYQNKKISLSVQTGTQFKQLEIKLYENIVRFEMTKNRKTIEQCQTILSKIIGFSTLDKDINFDYRLSVGAGKITSCKFFKPFYREQIQQYSKNKSGQFNKKGSAANFVKSSNQPSQHINYLHPNKDNNQYKICSPSHLYNISKCLAIGGFSKVYLGRSYYNGKFYVIKFIKKGLSHLFDSEEPENIEKLYQQKYETILNEIQINKELRHPFIVRMHHAFQTANYYCLVFDYCPGGELFYLLKKIKRMDQCQAKFYFLQILYAIQYMHQKKLIYRDLKPENILIDQKGNIKIVDFGLSKNISKCQKNKTYSYCGSAQYMAPEMILRIGHSYSADFYSLGTLLYQLVTGLPPFYTRDQPTLQKAIVCDELSFPSAFSLSGQIKDLLYKLLQKDSKVRLGSLAGSKQIIFHPWIGKIKSSDILQKVTQSPFPPDLTLHNFDVDQLGDDEKQFTNSVISQFKNIQTGIMKIKIFFQQKQELAINLSKVNKEKQQLVNNIGQIINKEIQVSKIEKKNSYTSSTFLKDQTNRIEDRTKSRGKLKAKLYTNELDEDILQSDRLLNKTALNKLKKIQLLKKSLQKSRIQAYRETSPEKPKKNSSLSKKYKQEKKLEKIATSFPNPYIESSIEYLKAAMKQKQRQAFLLQKKRKQKTKNSLQQKRQNNKSFQFMSKNLIKTTNIYGKNYNKLNQSSSSKIQFNTFHDQQIKQNKSLLKEKKSTSSKDDFVNDQGHMSEQIQEIQQEF